MPRRFRFQDFFQQHVGDDFARTIHPLLIALKAPARRSVRTATGVPSGIDNYLLGRHLLVYQDSLGYTRAIFCVCSRAVVDVPLLNWLRHACDSPGSVSKQRLLLWRRHLTEQCARL
jgi:hypothetical protein